MTDGRAVVVCELGVGKVGDLGDGAVVDDLVIASVDGVVGLLNCDLDILLGFCSPSTGKLSMMTIHLYAVLYHGSLPASSILASYYVDPDLLVWATLALVAGDDTAVELEVLSAVEVRVTTCVE